MCTIVPIKAGKAITPSVLLLSQIKRDNTGKMIHKGTEYIFTDGAALANGYVNCTAAWGVYFGDDDVRNQSGRIENGPASNQVAELTAIRVALEHCKDKRSHPLVIVTDSKYAIDCLTKWYKSWEKNHWKTQKGEPVKHQQILKECLNVLACGGVTFLHVNSHRRPPSASKESLSWILWYGNSQADRLAGHAVTQGTTAKVTW